MLSYKSKKNWIKAPAFLFLSALLIWLLNNCQEEKAHERSYPQVRTRAVSNITPNGATFNGDIYSMGAEPVIEHGFVWGTGEDPTLLGSKVLLGPASSESSFSSDIVTSLTKDEEYTVKAFVQSAEHVVYGLPVTFKSLGSGAPVVSGFLPDSAAWLDTIRISGKNFSYVVGNNHVKLNQTPCRVISANDTLLVVEVSALVSDLKNLVSVEMEGNISVYREDTLKFISPELTYFIPKKAYWGDTLKIKGKHFRSLNSQTANNIFLGTLKCERLSGSLTDTSVSVKIPSELPNILSDLSMKINGMNLMAKQQFELLPPFFTFVPESGTWGNTITLTGRFNSQISRTKVYFNSDEATIVSLSINSLKIKVPQSLNDIKSVLIYTSDPFKITSLDTFHLAAPVIESFSPVKGPSGIDVTIKGKNFDVSNPNVLFGDIPAGISAVNDSTIIAKVPYTISGKVKISIQAKTQTAVSSGYFDITNPKINNVFPLSGSFDDEITITGENLLPLTGVPTVTFEGIEGTVKSYSATAITVLVPASIDSVPRVLTVNTGLYQVPSAQAFVLSPPQITSVSPGTFNPDQDVTINGIGFNPESERNIVLWDNYPLNIKSSSKTKVVATWPQALPRGNFGISITVGGYTRTSSQKFISDSPWLRIYSPNIITAIDAHDEGLAINAKSIQNNGYLYSLANSTTFIFNQSDQSWSHLPVYQGMYAFRKGEVVCRDTFYLIMGVSSMLALDQDDNLWREPQISWNPSLQSGIAFSLNNKIYFGLDYSSTNRSLYECDPGNSYSWTRLGDFPIEPTFPYSTYFSVGNKGYAVFSDNSVWQFDPELLQWNRKSDFPGSARKLAYSFAIADKAFMGSGQSVTENVTYSDLWEYYPNTDTWTLRSFMPGDRQAAVGFSIGDKAYIGFGLQRQEGKLNQLYDFYEFDPNYPVK